MARFVRVARRRRNLFWPTTALAMFAVALALLVYAPPDLAVPLDVWVLVVLSISVRQVGDGA
jgi:hypothetical protein